jgi:hypothetical protein
MMTDIDAEKARLIDDLDDARRRTLAILQDADADCIVYPDSGWCVKDMAAHILLWEVEALAAVRARQQGESYTIADLDGVDQFSERGRVRYCGQSLTQIKTGLHTVRKEMKTILRALPPDCFAGMMAYPWPWTGSLSALMAIMAEHERQHADEIRQALQSGESR